MAEVEIAQAISFVASCIQNRTLMRPDGNPRLRILGPSLATVQRATP
jgi:hypothetical protein